MPVLDNLVDELIENAKSFKWPEYSPDVREKWARAVESKPDILQRLGKKYKEQITYFFYKMDDLGRYITYSRYDDSAERLEKIEIGIKKFIEEMGSVKKGGTRISAVLNLSHPDNVNRNTLLEIAYYKLMNQLKEVLANNSIKRGLATWLKILAVQDGSKVTLQFLDNGIGLPNEDRIFEFGESYSGGQGFGLFLVRQIIEAHNGTITAKAHNDNAVYGGALFTITLPKKQDSAIVYPKYF